MVERKRLGSTVLSEVPDEFASKLFAEIGPQLSCVFEVLSKRVFDVTQRTLVELLIVPVLLEILYCCGEDLVCSRFPLSEGSWNRFACVVRPKRFEKFSTSKGRLYGIRKICTGFRIADPDRVIPLIRTQSIIAVTSPCRTQHARTIETRYA
ncbi:hypothetical protein K933_17287 [Candidatus Halobonum tyrrellensis G22]|uniref:Uncharacterized protein n=1 Tax=Candidatus Halobonum tyrrellensis G22 TaxID=1324957 RepID=V4HGE1_9EURY|nr:hypothetical protein K933_17287 [Candidatus Halobonum tyrrellensis G22]